MALPVEILLGIYLGVLTGIIPALVAWGLGFLFRYFTGVTIPGFGVVVLGVAIAGINGGLLGLYDQVIRRSPTLVTAVIVVMMMVLYAHNRGDKMGATFPRRISLRRLRSQTLSTDVVELVGGRGQVRVTVAGGVTDLEGHPPLPGDLRAEIEAWSEQFPADLPLGELEDRVADRLRTTFDLADASVRLDERARATVAAAPPTGALSKRVPAGNRAVSVDGLVPTGVARRDEVRLTLPDGAVEGVVLSARSDRPGGTRADGGAGGRGSGPSPTAGPHPDGGEPPAETPPAPRAPTTDGGEGQVTVAVDRAAAERLLAVDTARVVVRSRGTRREYELVSLLRQAGLRIRRVTVVADGPLDGDSLGRANVREAFGVAVLAIRHAGQADAEWLLAPGGEEPVAAGDELFVVGTGAALDAFREAAA